MDLDHRTGLSIKESDSDAIKIIEKRKKEMEGLVNRARIFITSVFRRENVRPEELGVEYSSNAVGSRKRTATSLFEPEITDDEDEIEELGIRRLYSKENEAGTGPVTASCSKRQRHTENIDEMADKRRSINIPIVVEGSEKQKPWEFPVVDKHRTRKIIGDACGVFNAGYGRGHSSAEAEKKNTLGATVQDNVYNREAPGTSKSSRHTQTGVVAKPSIPGPSHMTRINVLEYPDKPRPSVARKPSIEVITLDDEPLPKSKPKCREIALLPSAKEMTYLKRPQSTAMKTRGRDTNRITNAMTKLGSKFASATRATVVRLQEKHKYMELLMAHNIMNNKGTYDTTTKHLTKSRVERSQLQVMYNRFGASPTDGGVSFRVGLSRRSLPPSTPITVLKDDPSLSKALVPVPKLFSTPRDLEVLSPTSRPKMKAITYEKSVPELVDLEAEKNREVKILSPITPTTGPSRKFISPEKIPFSNLDEALNFTGLAEPSTSRNEGAMSVPQDETGEEDPDLSIIAERIIDKSRRKTINTLALEQSSCPYVEKRWLDDSRTSWRERQQQREDRIRQETAALTVLRNESTLAEDLNERIRKRLTLTEIIVLEEPPPTLPEISEEMRRIINHAKMRGNDNEVLAQVRLLKDTIDITRGDIKTLGGLQWLNDNVINTYLGLIALRGKLDNYPNVYTFQTFFYPKLLKEGYSNSLKRWTRKDDIFSYDLIILPIHLGMHWCLACVDLRKKAIRYFDSMGGDNFKCLNSILEYLTREMKERKQVDLNKSEWIMENVKGIPQQENGSDCGMFACKFAEYLSRDAKITFTQKDMPYYRDRMIYELVKQDLMFP